jgi:hypothetical protein
MNAFVEFFEQEIQERGSKIFKTKKRLDRLIQNQIQRDAEEETDGTAIQNSNDNVEDIIKRNIIASQDVPLEKVIFKIFLLHFRIINNSFDPDPILF